MEHKIDENKIEGEKVVEVGVSKVSADGDSNKDGGGAETVTGLPVNTEAALCYLFGWITGLLFLMIENKNKEIRFHALQSLVVFGVGQVAIMFVPIFGQLLVLGMFGLWLFLVFKTYQGEKVVLPVVGEWAENQIK